MLIATISLAFQVGIIILLLGGYLLKRKKRFRQHGITMLTGVVLHLIVIMAIMVPSFVLGIIPLISTNATIAVAIIAPVHAITGTTTAILGVWIVASWRLRGSFEYCAPKKKIMRATLILWATTLTIGVLLYLSLYTTLLS